MPKFVSSQDTDTPWRTSKDGASQIARLLFEEATKVELYVGRAINPAHQNPNLPLNLSLKLRLMEDLAALLEKMGKSVSLRYY